MEQRIWLLENKSHIIPLTLLSEELNVPLPITVHTALPVEKKSQYIPMGDTMQKFQSADTENLHNLYKNRL